MPSAWWTRWRAKALSRRRTPRRRISSSSTPAISARRPPRKSIRSSAGLRLAKEEAARDGRDMKIAVAGCVAQAEGEEIIRRAPVVDVVVGPQSYHHLPELLARAERGGKAIETEFPAEDKFGFLPQPKPDAIRARGISAFVTVQEGCDKFCTFCVVPYTRGAEVSRPVGEDRRRREAARRQRRARNHADRAERQCLSRRRTGWRSLAARQVAASPGRNSRRRAPALFDQPSPRCRGQPDRGASRPAGADALRASAGAVGFRPDSLGHEPQTYRPRLPRCDRPFPSSSAKTLHFHQILSSASPARPSRIFPPPSRLSRKSDTLPLIRSNIRRGRERRRRRCGRRFQQRTWTSDWRDSRN